MNAPLPFGTQLIGQVERTLATVLEQILRGSGVNKTQWIALTMALRDSEPVPARALAGRVAEALKVDASAAQSHLHALVRLGLLQVLGDDGSERLVANDAGRHWHADVRSSVDTVTRRVWGDLPPQDLDAVARVLNIVLERATGELAQLKA